VDAKRETMEHAAPAKNSNSAIMPYRKIKLKINMSHTLHLLDEQQVISYSCNDGSFQVWDLERGTQVGKEWEDKEKGMYTTALSPDSKTIANGNEDGSVKLWNIDTSKIIETWMGLTNQVQSLCWSPDGGRVVSGYRSSGIVDATFRVWDVESGKTILGPIGVGQYLSAVCYSPDGKMIATSGDDLEIWDANSGELLAAFEGFFTCLAWTSDGKTLIAGKSKIDTATWTILDMGETRVKSNSLSPNECILASTPEFDKTVQLWNLETNKHIGTSLHHEDYVNCTTFSADGRFLFTICINGYIYKWDLSAIVKEAGLHLDIVSLDKFHLQLHRQWICSQG
jgi:WD40 repeat protein